MKHKQELIDILMNDAKLRCAYSDGYGNTCAIGGMAVAFGWNGKPVLATSKFSSVPINKQPVSHILSKSRSNMSKAIKKAQVYFGLTFAQLDSLQICNDQFTDTETRHRRLKETVESWEEE